MKSEFKVTVHYAAAGEPFQDMEASRTETLGELKRRVMAAFGLAEETGSDGTAKTYKLYERKIPLETLSQTAGDVAGHQHHLVLKLVEELVQGDGGNAVSLSELTLMDDLAGVLVNDDAVRWAIERPAPLEIWATMHPVSRPEEAFQLRLLWHSYPDQPPSLKFRDPATGRLDNRRAWPNARGFRPSSLDACVNYSLEGFNLHPEWRNDPRYRWVAKGNVLLKLLRRVQDELDETFTGRFSG